jgi:hypothetical protein
VLRPMVAALAEKLRNDDWDCQRDSEHFERFPREMLGLSDKEYGEYLGDYAPFDDPNSFYAKEYAKWLATQSSQ